MLGQFAPQLITRARSFFWAGVFFVREALPMDLRGRFGASNDEIDSDSTDDDLC